MAGLMLPEDMRMGSFSQSGRTGQSNPGLPSPLTHSSLIGPPASVRGKRAGKPAGRQTGLTVKPSLVGIKTLLRWIWKEREKERERERETRVWTTARPPDSASRYPRAGVSHAISHCPPPAPRSTHTHAHTQAQADRHRPRDRHKLRGHKCTRRQAERSVRSTRLLVTRRHRLLVTLFHHRPSVHSPPLPSPPLASDSGFGPLLTAGRRPLRLDPPRRRPTANPSASHLPVDVINCLVLSAPAHISAGRFSPSLTGPSRPCPAHTHKHTHKHRHIARRRVSMPSTSLMHRPTAQPTSKSSLASGAPNSTLLLLPDTHAQPTSVTATAHPAAGRGTGEAAVTGSGQAPNRRRHRHQHQHPHQQRGHRCQGVSTKRDRVVKSAELCLSPVDDEARLAPGERPEGTRKGDSLVHVLRCSRCAFESIDKRRFDVHLPCVGPGGVDFYR
ncbi:unnamed protein product, partial [Protopolystoma xenopodis]